jgi:phospholipid/cholesterol/gamma-HCH transport system substrate-binding protein
MNDRVPAIVDNLDTTIANASVVVADIRKANLAETVARVDTAIDNINILFADVRAQEGTLGQLIYDKSLYANINTTVQSADSLLVDLKANPRRYVHFSLFGGKDKSDKKKIKK